MRITRKDMTGLIIVENVLSYMFNDSFPKEDREFRKDSIYWIDVTANPAPATKRDPEKFRTIFIRGTMGHQCSFLLRAREFTVKALYTAEQFSVLHEGNWRWRPHRLTLLEVTPYMRWIDTKLPLVLDETLPNFASPRVYAEYLAQQDKLREETKLS